MRVLTTVQNFFNIKNGDSLAQLFYFFFTSIRTIFYFIPNLGPLFSPVKWSFTYNAYFTWKMCFFHCLLVIILDIKGIGKFSNFGEPVIFSLARSIGDVKYTRL